jgi:uncharacterized ferritin-like protein (DUF455 family)
LQKPFKELRAATLTLLVESDAVLKANQVQALAKQWQAAPFDLAIDQEISTVEAIPGRPEKPNLIAPRLLKRRKMTTKAGRAALIHALAHIEFNAVNLALDAVWRFPNMPAQYYSDWLKVAGEEAYHFSLLNGHLQTLGFAYGDYDGHDSLWEMVEKTKGCVLARMALVPRVMEARGLDANPSLRNKLAQAGDQAAADIMDIILRDEIGHVLIGNHWFNFLCNKDAFDPITTFDDICKQYEAPKLKPPFNIEARRAAGFSEVELDYLTQA